jgi:NAD-dependent dihydropyrimidine dehydrogenase PreA subunit
MQQKYYGNNLESIIKVDESLCIGCGSCVRACPGGLITKKDFPVPIENAWDQCIDCGHYIAICPTGAMHQRAMGPDDCETTIGSTYGMTSLT